MKIDFNRLKFYPCGKDSETKNYHHFMGGLYNQSENSFLFPQKLHKDNLLPVFKSAYMNRKNKSNSSKEKINFSVVLPKKNGRG